MVIVHVMGGLGNQLYQYAMYYKLKRLGKEVSLDFYDYLEAEGKQKEWRRLELPRFKNLDYETCTKEDRTRILDNSLALKDKIRRKISGRKKNEYIENKAFDPEIEKMDEVYLSGFWECDKYYEEFEDELVNKIIFPKSDNQRNYDLIKKMEAHNSVSVHIRRTDYLTVADGKRYTGICTEKYYEAAFEYISKRVSNPVFYIFSDDPDYCLEKYTQPNMHVIDWNMGDDSIFDMELMSHCKHNICANSTFSLWGAKLNKHTDKMMIRPLRHDNYETDSPETIQEQWKKWILIDHEGRVY